MHTPETAMPALAQSRNGHLEASSLAADAPKLAPKALHVQVKIADLQRDFVAEVLRIASIKAWHAADDLVLGDDASAERGIRIAVLNLREAATGFRQLEALTSAIEALGERAPQ